MPVDSRHYGTTHRQLRAHLVARYEHDGRGWPCALCHQTMTDPPTQLHLAHDDVGSGWLGLSHARCNSGDAARLGHDRRAGRLDPDPEPRTRW